VDEKVKENEEEIIKIEENEIDLKEDVGNETANGNDSDSNNKKKPRGSRYRGVSRNGNQWQVRKYFTLLLLRF
jgi:hypothetical protein